jgi:hypothetical protein
MLRFSVSFFVALALCVLLLAFPREADSRVFGVAAYVVNNKPGYVTYIAEVPGPSSAEALPNNLFLLESTSSPFIFGGGAVSNTTVLFGGTVKDFRVGALFVVNVDKGLRKRQISVTGNDIPIAFLPVSKSKQLFVISFSFLNITKIWSAYPPTDPTSLKSVAAAIPKGHFQGATYSPSAQSIIMAIVDIGWKSGSIVRYTPQTQRVTTTSAGLLPVGVYYDSKTDDVIVIQTPQSQQNYSLWRMDNKGGLVKKFNINSNNWYRMSFNAFDPIRRAIYCTVYPSSSPDYYIVLVKVDQAALPTMFFNPSPSKNFLVYDGSVALA